MTNLAHHLQQQHTAKKTVTSGVTELILTNDTPEQLSLLLPMVAFLSNASSERWITWVAPHNISKELLESYAVNTRFIRVIHVQNPQALLRITLESLCAGNSHTVISSLGKLTDKELTLLESAAHKGQCQGVLLRVR